MIKRKPRTPPPPGLEQWDTETKFDKWVSADVETALETALADMTHQMDRMRHCDREQRAQLLALMDNRLLTAQQAVHSLRRRVANDKRN